MHRFTAAIAATILVFLTFAPPTAALASEKRLALVIGNAAYGAKTLATPANDAALVAETLRAAGFEVMGARDLDTESLRQAFRQFVEKVGQAGPEAVAFVYFAGLSLQLDGENYLIPTNVEIAQPSDLMSKALSLTEQTHSFASLHFKAALVVVDAARESPFSFSRQQPTSGLSWTEPGTNMLIAFSAAPDTVAPDGDRGYGPYAIALAEMIRQGGLTLSTVFERVRLRVDQLTRGAQVPWHVSDIQASFEFFDRSPEAPQRADPPERSAQMRLRPMHGLGAGEAYWLALLRDTLDGYAEFVAEYWNEPMAKRVRGLLAARREALIWRRSRRADTPNAYWTYLAWYPHGPHVVHARRLLSNLGANAAPPSNFARLEFDIPPPFPDELAYADRPVLLLDDPMFGLEPPPLLPADLLDAQPPEFRCLAPPPAAPSAQHVLPRAAYLPVPSYIRVPADVLARGDGSIADTRDVSGAGANIDKTARDCAAPPTTTTNAVDTGRTQSASTAIERTPSENSSSMSGLTSSRLSTENPSAGSQVAPRTVSTDDTNASPTLRPTLSDMPPQTAGNAKPRPKTGAGIPIPRPRLAAPQPSTGKPARGSSAAIQGPSPTGLQLSPRPSAPSSSVGVAAERPPSTSTERQRTGQGTARLPPVIRQPSPTDTTAAITSGAPTRSSKTSGAVLLNSRPIPSSQPSAAQPRGSSATSELRASVGSNPQNGSVRSGPKPPKDTASRPKEADQPKQPSTPD